MSDAYHITRINIYTPNEKPGNQTHAGRKLNCNQRDEGKFPEKESKNTCRKIQLADNLNKS